jgi:3-hydroxybutyryl-CoA dehydratase
MKKGDKFQTDFIVDDEIYNGFIDLFKDKNPLHTDLAFAEAKGFKGPVMHGNILNGFLSFFIGECLPEKNVLIHSQEIKYLHPVYKNEKLKLVAEVENVFESVKVAELKFFFENHTNLKIAKGKINIGIDL